MQADTEININVNSMLGNIQNIPFPSLVTPQPTGVALGAAVEPCEEPTDVWQSTREFLKYLRTSWKAALTVCYRFVSEINVGFLSRQKPVMSLMLDFSQPWP